MPTYYDNSTNEKNADDNSADTITKTLRLTTSEEKIILKQLKKYEFKISYKKLILKWVYSFIISAEHFTISDYLYLG